MSRTASAAIAPNTPSAIDSGSIARSAFSSAVDVYVALLNAPMCVSCGAARDDLGVAPLRRRRLPPATLIDVFV